ncbi:FecR domain-containing protein [Spirosoma taeanense]|uniref:FecR domain-containing protein n=1 Tax=Spirosoma taeanense TaxID=2735870 RepID=A0A6M5Y5I0_9BACT|nr:FecR family protein [Spirosoma taeanense]QJW88640.1 FecR domain-containing protein [Spirosoma taeanense]
MYKKPYSAYSAEEFALDDLFVRWVKHPDDEEVVAYWHLWLTNNPHCNQTVELARKIIQTAAQPSLPALSSDEVSTLWGRIRVSLQTMEDVRPLQPNVRTVVGWWYFWRSVAAALGLVLLVGWAVWMQYGPNQSVRTISTRSNQIQFIRLPDNSSVKLYPNSSVKYAQRWTDETPRAVWLRGEADFSVAHHSDTSAARLFRVHVTDLTVEALGTMFRVREQPECTRIFMTSGQVNLVLKEQKSLRLKSGDSVEVVAGQVQPLP